MGVFLSYPTGQGRVLLDRDLYLPHVWSKDWERRQEGGDAGLEADEIRLEVGEGGDDIEENLSHGVAQRPAEGYFTPCF